MITKGKVVNLSYELKDSEGNVMDQADAKEPFVYLHGADQIVPGLEAGLVGLKVGDKKTISVPPADAYGEINPSLKLTVKRTQFPKEAMLKEGMQFEAHAGDGNTMLFTIESIKGDDVSIDGNHPLAGKTLHFNVEVLAVRDATEEEKSHGHAHGEHGHHH